MADKAKKKSKKVRNLIIGLAVLLLLAGALAVLLLTTSAPEEESSESSAYESTLVDLVVSEAEEINGLTVENARGGFEIIRVSEATEDEDAVYGIEELESFLTDESELSSIIDQFANVSAMRLIEENAPDIAKYGLDDPTYVVTTYYDDGTTHTFTVGDTLTTGSGAYMMFDDDPNVYSMGDTKMSRLGYTALDFLELGVIDAWESYTDEDGNEVTAPSIEYLQVTGGTLDDVFRIEPLTESESGLASSYGSTFRIVSPVESDFRVKTNAEGGDDNAVYTTGLQSLDALSVEAINPTEEDMAAYGLDEPYCTIEFSRDGAEHTWLVGSALTTGDGTAAHYFYSEDQPVIYVVADSDLPWISMQMDGLYTPQQLLPYIDDVERIELMVYGDSYTFEIDAADPDDEDSDIVPHFDGEEIELDHYRKMYQYLLLAPAEGIYDGEPNAGELAAAFTYYYRDGGSDTVELYDLGNRTCILSINGNCQWTTRSAYVTYLQTNIERLQNGEQPSLDY